MNEPTPGPWTAKGPSKPVPDAPEGGDWAILDSKGEIIGEAFRHVSQGENGLRPAEQNARLMAAAYSMREALRLAKRLCDEALPKFNWGASALNANAIALLNEVPAKITEAIRQAELRE